MLESLEPRTLMSGWVSPVFSGREASRAPSVGAEVAVKNSGVVAVISATTISGWAFSSANDGAPVNVVITIDGVETQVLADGDRPDLVKKLGSANHGFSYDVPGLATGKHTVTVELVDPVSSARQLLKSGFITIAPPVGLVQTRTISTIAGYAFSAANGGAAIDVIITINGNAVRLTADDDRPDLVKKLGSANHGFSYSVPALPTGSNSVTVDIVDGSTGDLKRIFTGSLVVGLPVGLVSTFTTSTIAGWAFNPASGSAAVNVVITINGEATTITAGEERQDLVAKYGSAFHRFSFDVPALSPGVSAVTVDLVDPFTGQTLRLRTGTLVNAVPVAKVDIASATEIAGMATDAGMSGPIKVRIDVDGVAGAPFLANDSRKVSKGMNVGFDAVGDYAGKVVEVYAYDESSDTPVLVWTNNHKPRGAVTSWSGTNISGWAVDDDDLNTPVSVRIEIDGELLTTVVSNLSRPDVAKKARATDVGFSVDIPGLTPGAHTISAYAIEGTANSVGPVLLGAKKVINNPPTGALETLNTSIVSGWAMDVDSAEPVTVNVYVDSQLFATVTADGDDAMQPGHGFSVDLSSVPAGSHSITLTVMDDRESNEQEVIFFDDFINNHQPIGAIESVTGTTITGWAQDPDTATSPTAVDVYIDGTYVDTVAADDERVDLVASLGSANHGWTLELPALEFGTHTITAYASESQGNVSSLIGTMSVTNNRPVGALEAASNGFVSGWAKDPDRSAESVTIVVYVNGVEVKSGTANGVREDVGAHGFMMSVSGMGVGSNRVDVYAEDLNNGMISLIGSSTIVVNAVS